jgi:hypothetical protein
VIKVHDSSSFSASQTRFGASISRPRDRPVGINQRVGPVLFKVALDRNGESRTGDQVRLARMNSIAPAVMLIFSLLVTAA